MNIAAGIDFRGGPTIVRNNIIQTAQSTPSGVPLVLQTNAILGGYRILGGLDALTADAINALPGASGNFVTECGALTTGSPCVDAGTPEGAPDHDYYGTPRGSAPDIGPVETMP